ncbi:MAG TPA: glycosyltransferase family 4 protein [Vicinamibacterales bacterium]|nr:glycosyltransferase family 4 protein [Vicinamibacterales bacterium]
MKQQGSGPVPIAFVMSSCHAGGTERQMIELLRRLDPARWQVHIACIHASGEWLSRASEAAASVKEFPFPAFRHPHVLLRTREFIRWCREQSIAVVHTADLNANIFALPAAAAAGVAVRIANRREIIPGRTRSQIVAQRAAYQFAHKIVANCHAAADRLRIERVSAARIATVPNGVDPGVFSATRLRRPLRRVTIVANLQPNKGHDVLIDAAPEILRHFPDARFDVVGSGPERTKLQARAAAQGVAAAFAFVGYDADVPQRLRDADVFVLPSYTEAFPNAVLEAMCAGLPIVASGVGGLLELVDDGRTGLLVAPGDPRALAHAVCRVMANRALGERLGKTAAQDVQRYSYSRMTSSFELLYLAELNRRGAPLGQTHALAS